MLAIGVVVDDAIVVVEDVETVMHENPELDPADAVKKSMDRITAPIIAIKLSAYCQQENISQAYAVRLFHRFCNCSPVEYLLQKKLEMAQRLLHYSQLSVKEIAARLAFSDQYHFSTFYKKRTGESPTSFRNKWK